MGPALERVRYTVMKNPTSWNDVKLFERTFYDPKMNLMKEKRISFRRKTQFFFSQAYFGTKTKDHSKWSWAFKWWFYNFELVFYLHVNIGETIPYKKNRSWFRASKQFLWNFWSFFYKKTKENLKKKLVEIFKMMWNCSRGSS